MARVVLCRVYCTCVCVSVCHVLCQASHVKCMNNKHARLFCLRIKSYCAYRSVSLSLFPSFSICMSLLCWQMSVHLEAGHRGRWRRGGGSRKEGQHLWLSSVCCAGKICIEMRRKQNAATAFVFNSHSINSADSPPALSLPPSLTLLSLSHVCQVGQHVKLWIWIDPTRRDS